MRSANAARDQRRVVMIAKVSWNMAYTVSGMVSAKCDTVILFASFMMVIAAQKCAG